MSIENVTVRKQCAFHGCTKQAHPRQKYCSREHAPYASLLASTKPGAYESRTTLIDETVDLTQKNYFESHSKVEVTNFDRKFGKLLRTAREKAGIDLAKLREISGVRFQSTLKNIEDGDFDPYIAAFIMAARNCGISLDEVAASIKFQSPAAKRLLLAKEKQKKRVEHEIAKLKALDSQGE